MADTGCPVPPYSDAPYSDPPYPDPPRRRRRRRRAVLAGVVVLALAGGGAYAAGWGRSSAADAGPDPAAVAQARAFLADWAGGRLSRAGGRTTSPAEAETVLRNFTAGLDIDRPGLTAAAATRADDGTVTVPYTARMRVAGLGTWTYRSKLPLRELDGTWKVAWRLSVVHPRLSGTEKFRLDRAEGTAPEATAHDGKRLSGFPSLGPVLSRLPGAKGSGPRGAIRLIDRETGKVERTEARFGAKKSGRADGSVRTTLDTTWQAAAEKALAAKARGKEAALVALRIDDGSILAVANSPAAGFDRAVSGTYAPGSTWKIVTSSALLLEDAVRPTDTVDCPRYLTVGKRFHNVETGEHRGATFLQDFTESCNTAFISLRGKLGDGELGDVARTYFGVGRDWHIGIPSFDGSVPAPRDETEKAASMIGQGRVLGNPLTMASVTATAVSGRFHQPVLVPGGPGGARAGGTKPLPAKVVTQLRSMMRATVTGGTATGLADLPGAIGAKTGTAEVNDEDPNNGWIVAYRGDVAVACVVEGGRTGSASAVPVVHDLLAAVPGDAR